MAIKELARRRRIEGKNGPKSSQIHGLRNRRRIYNDIVVVLDRIAMLKAREKNDEGPIAT